MQIKSGVDTMSITLSYICFLSTGLTFGLGNAAAYATYTNTSLIWLLILASGCVAAHLTWALAANWWLTTDRLVQGASLLQLAGWALLLLKQTDSRWDRSPAWLLLGSAAACLTTILPANLYQQHKQVTNILTGHLRHLTICVFAGIWLAETLYMTLGLESTVLVSLVLSVAQALTSLGLSWDAFQLTKSSDATAGEPHCQTDDTTTHLDDYSAPNPPQSPRSRTLGILQAIAMATAQNLIPLAGVGLPIVEVTCANMARRPRVCYRIITTAQLGSMLLMELLFSARSVSKFLLLSASSFLLAGSYQLILLTTTPQPGDGILFKLSMILLSLAGSVGWLQLPLVCVMERSHRLDQSATLSYWLMASWWSTGLLFHLVFHQTVHLIELTALYHVLSVCCLLTGLITLWLGRTSPRRAQHRLLP